MDKRITRSMLKKTLSTIESDDEITTTTKNDKICLSSLISTDSY